ncbi:hypothetical protein MHU86_17325 [Fragilaria crotonensis]|nr:hypothetical protein MHU86_17325 [Fragilaria crotonensis]
MRLLNLLLECALLSHTLSFSLFPYQRHWVRSKPLHAEVDERSSDDDTPSLLLGNDLDNELAKFKSKYPTSESDYLAAARKRAEERRESINSQSSDDDWKEMAKKKQAAGVVLDDWEQSLFEAGNADSQILIPIVLTDEGEDGDDPEPKLLLF